jgi:metal-responsive CopG/Arc/MetJ family transcriptional regulator
MPRPKAIQNRGFISLIIENKYVELLDKIARREGITKSELVRRVIIEWLETEAKIKYGSMD